MFKNGIVFRIFGLDDIGIDVVEDGLSKAQFTPCGATQERSAGWVPPRGEANGAMLESVGGQWIAKFFTEVKSVPGSVIARKVDEKVARIEQEAGRKPGKKERRELKEEAKLDLLPHAFTKQAATLVWIDRENRILLVDASTQSRAGDVVSALVEAIPGISLSLLHTKTSPQAAMANWLVEQEPPANFSIDRECELKACDESKAVVKYGHHPLDIEEIQQHVRLGKLPTKLALTWDDRVSFVLTEGLQLKKLSFLDVVFDDQDTDHDDKGFDTDVAIATGELSKLIPDLVAALGGYHNQAEAEQ